MVYGFAGYASSNNVISNNKITSMVMVKQFHLKIMIQLKKEMQEFVL